MDYAYTSKPFDFFTPSVRFLDPPVNKLTTEMRPIYLPVKKKPDINVVYQENGNTTPEEPEVTSNGVHKENFSGVVSNLISKFETNATPLPKRPSLIKSKSFSVRGSKREPKTNQTQDDALHNKSEAEVAEIRKMGVRDLRRKFEEIEHTSDSSNNSSPVRLENKSEEKSALENIAKKRLEHFKRLTKKWERDVGGLLRYLTETEDFDIYNVRIQDLELAISRDLHGIKIKPDEITSAEEVATPSKTIPEVEGQSLVAKITSLYEIKSKESNEEQPYIPIQTPKRLPWTTGRTPIREKREVEQQANEEVKPQEAVVTEEEQENVVIEESEPEVKEEPSSFVDTEHLKSASLITSYFNSLSNVNNRNNETSRLNETNENKQTSTPTKIAHDVNKHEHSSELEFEENNNSHETPNNINEALDESFNEPEETAQNESVNNEREEEVEQLKESSIQNDSAVDREFEKYYTEDLKPAGSEERLFEDYYRENVLEDAIPEEPEDDVKYDEDPQENISTVVENEEEEEKAEVEIVRDDDGFVHQRDISPVATHGNNNDESNVTKDRVIVDELPEVEEKGYESLQQAELEDYENNATTANNVVTKNVPQGDQTEPENTTKEEVYVTNEIPAEERSVDNNAEVEQCVKTVEEPAAEEEENEIAESVRNVEEPVAEKVSEIKPAVENEQNEITGENEEENTSCNIQYNKASLKNNEESETESSEETSQAAETTKYNEKQPDDVEVNENVEIVEIAPVMRHHSDHIITQQDDDEDGSCLKKYVLDTNDFLNHEKATT